MADEPQDRKTEEPTERRLEDARDEGRIARSRDVNTAVIFGVVLVVIWTARGTWVEQLRDVAMMGLQSPTLLRDAGPSEVLELAGTMMRRLLELCLPLAVVAMVAAIIASVLQTGGLFAPAAIKPQAERMNPVAGLEEIFSRRSAVEFLKTLFKIIVLGAVMALIVHGTLPVLVRMPQLPVLAVADVGGQVLARYFGLAVVAMALVAAFDWWFQRVDHRYRLRMTREEVKRERRDQEGDPQVRGQRRSLARQALSDTGLDRVPKASLVLHATADRLAVALFVDRAEGGQTWLLHKGSGHVASAIIAGANAARVRVVADASLARRIYAETAIDADLPPRLARDVRRLFV